MTDVSRTDGPTELNGRDWKEILLSVKDELAKDQVSLIAGGVAFYGLLALFPAITALVALGGLFFETDSLLGVSEQLSSVLPAGAAEIVITQMQAVVSSNNGGLGAAAILGIVLAVYSASKGVDNMIRGLNVAFDVEEDRGFVSLKLTVLALTLAFLLGLLCAVGIMVAVPIALEFVAGIPGVETALMWVRWPLLLMIGLFGIMILYRYGTAGGKGRWRWLAPGAIAATLLWVAGTAGFAVYVQMFDTYNETFGALAGVIVLLMWLWISAFVILLGAEIDAELEDEAGIPRG